MPRQVQIEHAGALRHATSRGGRGEDIYPDNVHRRDFLKFARHLAAKAHRPGWLRADRLLGEHGILPDSAAASPAQHVEK